MSAKFAEKCVHLDALGIIHGVPMGVEMWDGECFVGITPAIHHHAAVLGSFHLVVSNWGSAPFRRRL